MNEGNGRRETYLNTEFNRQCMHAGSLVEGKRCTKYISKEKLNAREGREWRKECKKGIYEMHGKNTSMKEKCLQQKDLRPGK